MTAQGPYRSAKLVAASTFGIVTLIGSHGPYSAGIRTIVVN